MKSIVPYLMIVLTLFWGGCTNEALKNDGIAGGPKYDTADLPSSTKSAMTNSVNDFSFELLREVCGDSDGDESLFLSPLSLSVDLSMLAVGASGETQSQILDVLGFSGQTVEEMNSYYRFLMEGLRSPDKVALDMANSIWVDREFPMYSSYINNLADNFEAQSFHVNMSSANTVEKINDWCSEKTSGRIERVVDDVIGAQTILINALHFKAAWENVFLEKTVESKFVTSSGVTNMVDMMSLPKQRLDYVESDDMQMVELPYENADFVLDIILPKGNVKSLLSSLDSEKWNANVSALKPEYLNVYIPKFSTKFSCSMEQSLINMGITHMFDTSADFSGISPKNIVVSRVLHQTWLDVSQKGTEAAAVTVIMVDGSADPGVGHEYKDFSADHAFLFVIRQRSTGAILFAGIKDK